MIQRALHSRKQSLSNNQNQNFCTQPSNNTTKQKSPNSSTEIPASTDPYVSNMNILQRQRIKSISDLTLEYKLLNDISASLGIYILPTLEDYWVWKLLIFIRQGYYKDARLEVYIHFDRHNHKQIQKIQFSLPIWHSLIDPETGILDLKTFKRLSGMQSSEKDNILAIITNLKQMFLEQRFILQKNSSNRNVSKTYQKSQILFIEKVFESTIIPSLNRNISFFEQQEDQFKYLFGGNQQQDGQKILKQLQFRCKAKQISQIENIIKLNEKLKQICFNDVQGNISNRQLKIVSKEQKTNQKIQLFFNYLIGGSSDSF